MRISFSIMLLVAAATQISAAATPYSASKCILTDSKGAGQGNGYKNYCCEEQADCIDDCVNGICTGPSAPTNTCTPGSSGLGQGDGYKGACCEEQSDCRDDCVKGACIGAANPKTTTTAAPTPTVAPGVCTPGSSGLGQGDGYKGACCKDQSDCRDDCVKGSCIGAANPKTTTTAAPTPTVAPGTCTPGSSGLGKGDGYKGACCKKEADCMDDCVKGACVGPVNPSATTVTVTVTATATAVPTVAPGVCTPGSSGLGQGDGYKGACCKDQSDCRDDCVKGSCIGAANPKTTTTAAPTPTVAPGTCTPGSSGLGKGDGYKGACCKKEADCMDDCVNGVCVGPVNTKTITTAPTPTAGACIAGFFGKGNGNGGNDACCKNSNDCKESCLSGRCGLA